MGLRTKPHTALIRVKDAAELYQIPRRWFTYHIERKHLTPLAKADAAHVGLDLRGKWLYRDQVLTTMKRFPYRKRDQLAQLRAS